MTTMFSTVAPAGAQLPCPVTGHPSGKYAYAAFCGDKCVGAVAICPPGRGADITARTVSDWILAGHLVRQVSASVIGSLMAAAMEDSPSCPVTGDDNQHLKSRGAE